MRFIGSMNFFSENIAKLHDNMKLLNKLLHDSFEIHLKNQVETLFSQITTSITKDV